MRSPFCWWCKCKWQALKKQFKDDPQFRIACVLVPLAVGFISYLASNSYLFQISL